MADCPCAVCGEPWDAWGIMQAEYHDKGDMSQEEAKLFRKGAGCPCCKGVTPEDCDPEEMAVSHVEARIYSACFDDDVYPNEVLENKRPEWTAETEVW